MTAAQHSERILVVDDQEAVADLYGAWLEPDYDVLTAYGGNQALELVDGAVDVIFLDRQMPDRSGDEVLDVVHDRDIDCRVVMVTAVDPGFDIVEMPFDDYLIKPVTREDLTETLEEMKTRSTYDEQMQEYFALVSKKATLDAEKNPATLARSDPYDDLTAQVETLGEEVDDIAADFDSFEGLFQEL